MRLFLLLILFSGCASYKIPVETDNHPATADSEISQIELSPILNLGVEN